MPPWLPTWEHWLTASSNCGLPLQISMRLGSSLLNPLVAPRLSSGLRVSAWLCPAWSAGFEFWFPSRYDPTRGAETVLPVGVRFASVMRLSVMDYR